MNRTLLAGAPRDYLSLLVAFHVARGGVLMDSTFGVTTESGARMVQWTPRSAPGGISVPLTAASGSSARPTLGALGAVFDGVANVMKGLDGLMAGVASYELTVQGPAPGGTALAYLVQFGDASNYAGLYSRSDNNHIGGVIVGSGPIVNQWQALKDAAGYGIWSTHAKLSDGDHAVAPNTLNGAALFGNTLGGSVDVSGVVFPSSQIAIGGPNLSSGNHGAMTARFISLFPAALSDADRATLTSLLAGASGYTRYSLLGAPYADTEVPIRRTGFDQVSSYARLVCTTDAEEIQLLTNEVTSTPQYTIGWRLNGGARTVVDVSGIAYPLLSPGSGGTQKTIELEAGPQSWSASPTSPNAGSYFSELWVPPGRSLVMQPQAAPAQRLVIVGDSIALGQAADTYQSHGFSMLMRAAWPGRTTCVVAGSYSLKNLTQNHYTSVSALANALIALADGTVTNELLIQVSVNDWFLNGWALVSTFQSDATTLLGLLLASGNFDKIFWQTAGPATIEATNGFGQTLADYRTAVTAAVAAQASPKVIVIDGTTLYSITGSIDGLHPITVEEANMATNEQTAMGF